MTHTLAPQFPIEANVISAKTLPYETLKSLVTPTPTFHRIPRRKSEFIRCARRLRCLRIPRRNLAVISLRDRLPKVTVALQKDGAGRVCDRPIDDNGALSMPLGNNYGRHKYYQKDNGPKHKDLCI